MEIAIRAIKIEPDQRINPAGEFTHMLVLLHREELMPCVTNKRIYLLFDPRHSCVVFIDEDEAKDIALNTLLSQGKLSKPV